MPNIEDQPYVGKVADPVINSTSSYWGLIGTLLLFIIILVVALWIIRRLNRSNMRMMNTSWVRVLDRQALSGQQTLYLVEIAGKLQVLGGSDHHLEKISEIDDPEVAAEILDEIVTRPADKLEGSLTKMMGNLLGQPRRKKTNFSKELQSLLEEVDK